MSRPGPQSFSSGLFSRPGCRANPAAWLGKTAPALLPCRHERNSHPDSGQPGPRRTRHRPSAGDRPEQRNPWKRHGRLCERRAAGADCPRADRQAQGPPCGGRPAGRAAPGPGRRAGALPAPAYLRRLPSADHALPGAAALEGRFGPGGPDPHRASGPGHARSGFGASAPFPGAGGVPQQDGIRLWPGRGRQSDSGAAPPGRRRSHRGAGLCAAARRGPGHSGRCPSLGGTERPRPLCRSARTARPWPGQKDPCSRIARLLALPGSAQRQTGRRPRATLVGPVRNQSRRCGRTGRRARSGRRAAGRLSGPGRLCP